MIKQIPEDKYTIQTGRRQLAKWNKLFDSELID